MIVVVVLVLAELQVLFLNRAVQKSCCQVSEWARLEKKDGLDWGGGGRRDQILVFFPFFLLDTELICQVQGVKKCVVWFRFGMCGGFFFPFFWMEKQGGRERTSEVFHRHGGTQNQFAKDDQTGNNGMKIWGFVLNNDNDERGESENGGAEKNFLFFSMKNE